MSTPIDKRLCNKIKYRITQIAFEGDKRLKLKTSDNYKGTIAYWAIFSD